jgi:hypothetical protein
MSFAKPRFDSTAKPLGRCLLNLDAVISTMDIVCGEYPATSKEHRGAAEFLHVLSQEANLVLFGMLADASDELLALDPVLRQGGLQARRDGRADSIQSEIAVLFR